MNLSEIDVDVLQHQLVAGAPVTCVEGSHSERAVGVLRSRGLDAVDVVGG